MVTIRGEQKRNDRARLDILNRNHYRSYIEFDPRLGPLLFLSSGPGRFYCPAAARKHRFIEEAWRFHSDSASKQTGLFQCNGPRSMTLATANARRARVHQPFCSWVNPSHLRVLPYFHGQYFHG